MGKWSKFILLTITILCAQVQGAQAFPQESLSESTTRAFAAAGPFGQVKVKAYKKKNGTVVKSHTRAKKSKARKK